MTSPYLLRPVRDLREIAEKLWNEAAAWRRSAEALENQANYARGKADQLENQRTGIMDIIHDKTEAT